MGIGYPYDFRPAAPHRKPIDLDRGGSDSGKLPASI